MNDKAAGECKGYGGEGECNANSCVANSANIPGCICDCFDSQDTCATKQRLASCENKITCSTIINGINNGGDFGGWAASNPIDAAAECGFALCGETGDCRCVCTNKMVCPENAPTSAATSNSKPIKPLPNPLGTSDIREIVARVIKIFTGVSGSFALLMFIYGGFLWVTSAGNMDKVKQGQKALINASLGLVIIFTAYGIIASIFKVLSGIAL